MPLILHDGAKDVGGLARFSILAGSGVIMGSIHGYNQGAGGPGRLAIMICYIPQVSDCLDGDIYIH